MLYNTLIILPGVLIAITLHEFAHGFVAYLNGDNTAKNNGRLTINPLKHLDPIGFFMLLIFKFGWAKPVQIDESNFKNRNLGLFTVSIAGIVMNLFLSIISIIGMNMLINNGINAKIIIDILYGIAHINISFAAFNILPIPPLDGSKIIYSILPSKMRFLFYKYESYGIFILLLLSFSNTIGYVLTPVRNVMYFLINSILTIIS